MVATATCRMLLVSAIASGQGKTSVTAALARKWKRLGLRVRVFKVGPDFIDPLLLERASGAPVRSLDLWIVGLDACRAMLAEAAAESDIILIEGVMGLYDGNPSSADLARAFGVPVLAVIDASAMAQTAGAVVHGLRTFGPVDLAGVVANRVASANHAKMVADSLSGTPMFASLPRQARSLPERHLGLVLPSEVDGIDALLDDLADQLQLARTAFHDVPKVTIEPAANCAPVEALLAGAVVAVARDAAFAFIHPANLDCLSALGAALRFFSPLANEPVPPESTAVYLPGGYPELHAEQLSQAGAFHASLRAAHAAGTPILAECGGMMALTDTLTDKAGATWPMAGLLQGAVSMQPRLAGLGAQALGELRGHTFHYSKLDTDVTPDAWTVKNPSGAQGEAVYRVGSLTASYFHAYFPSCPEAVAAMLRGSPA
ncbi:MAG: cobyrinate a,c-diamide synthase [Massilia sp.]